jgi:hypothetical protein
MMIERGTRGMDEVPLGLKKKLLGKSGFKSGNGLDDRKVKICRLCGYAATHVVSCVIGRGDYNG